MTLKSDDAPSDTSATSQADALAPSQADDAAPSQGDTAPSKASDAAPSQGPAGATSATAKKAVLRRSNHGLIWVSLVFAIAVACIDSYIGPRDSDTGIITENPTTAFIKLQLRVAREVVLNDEQRLGRALWTLASFKQMRGETAAAQRLYEQALKMPMSSTDRTYIEGSLTEIYEKNNNRQALPGMFMLAHRDDVVKKKLLGFQMVNIYDRGKRIFEQAGDKGNARKMTESAEKSRRIPTMEMGDPRILRVSAMRTWQLLGDIALVKGEHAKARKYYTELVDDKVSNKHFQCRGRIGLFVTSVDAGDVARAQEELPAARESAAWLKAHARLGFRDEATFMAQYALLLEAQGKTADAERIAEQAKVAYKVGDWTVPQPESFARSDEE